MQPVPLEIVHMSYQDDYYSSPVRISTMIPRKKNHVIYISSREIVVFMYLTDPKMSFNEQILGL